MIKAGIVRRISDYLKLKDKEGLAVVDKIIESMKDVIAASGRLEIRDFGVFQIKRRKPRTGRNPKNKKEYPIAPRSVVTFKAGKALKSRAVSTSSES
ncbi:integration host factor subunit beta [Candidatus Sumerlaeota bacterium]|nr:integration host factor subunit beta [Candidatus Sumerlaeota bacterium]